VVVVLVAIAVLLAGAGLLRLAIGSARARRAAHDADYVGSLD
jgi:hypothetical protein